MSDKYTEGVRLYLEEEYEEALEPLKISVYGPEDPHQTLVNSIIGELLVTGQAGVLNEVVRGTVSSPAVLLDLLSDSSNEGVRYAADLINEIKKDTPAYFDPNKATDMFVEAAANSENSHVFFFYSAGFFRGSVQISIFQAKENDLSQSSAVRRRALRKLFEKA